MLLPRLRVHRPALRIVRRPPLVLRGTILFLFKTFKIVNGGARRNRTDDLYNAIVALSQLSYDPNPFQPGVWDVWYWHLTFAPVLCARPAPIRRPVCEAAV